MIRLLLFGLSIATVLISYSTFFYVPIWWSRITDVAQHYLLILTSFLIILFISLLPLKDGWNLLMILLLFCALISHLSKVLPYTTIYPKEIKEGDISSPSIKLLSSNILKSNQNTAAFEAVISEFRPDVLLVIEYTPYWEKHATFLKDFPYSIKEISKDYGLALFSKLPLKNGKIEHLINPQIPSIHTDINFGDNRLLHFIGIHPSPPLPNGISNTLEKDMETLVVSTSNMDQSIPRLIVGDFNDVAWSGFMKTFKKLGKLKDPRIGRGFYHTYHAQKPYLRYPIDHIFLSENLCISQFQRLNVKGSDHFALYANIHIEKDQSSPKSPLIMNKF